jgi:hypothetical protein
VRGWEQVGYVAYPREFVFNANVRPDDILAVSPLVDVTALRCGFIRARDAYGEHPLWAIPAIASGDYVYRATAIGEHAFSKPSTSTPSD